MSGQGSRHTYLSSLVALLYVVQLLVLFLESLHEAFLFVDQYLGPIKLAPTLVVTLKSVDKGEEEMGFQPRGGFSWLVVVGCAGGGCVFEADGDDAV